jgi:hypothetical protein
MTLFIIHYNEWTARLLHIKTANVLNINVPLIEGKANGDSQQQPEDDSDFVSFLLQIIGVRV